MNLETINKRQEELNSRLETLNLQMKELLEAAIGREAEKQSVLEQNVLKTEGLLFDIGNKQFYTNNLLDGYETMVFTLRKTIFELETTSTNVCDEKTYQTLS